MSTLLAKPVVKSEVLAFKAKLVATSEAFAFKAKLVATSVVLAFDAKLVVTSEAFAFKAKLVATSVVFALEARLVVVANELKSWSPVFVPVMFDKIDKYASVIYLLSIEVAISEVVSEIAGPTFPFTVVTVPGATISTQFNNVEAGNALKTKLLLKSVRIAKLPVIVTGNASIAASLETTSTRENEIAGICTDGIFPSAPNVAIPL